jgi:hypothetical protein
MRCRVIFEKKLSTALSQEAEVGAKWKVSADGAPARLARGAFNVHGIFSFR